MSIQLLHLSSQSVSCCLVPTQSFTHICHYCNFIKFKSLYTSLILQDINHLTHFTFSLLQFNPLFHPFCFFVFENKYLTHFLWLTVFLKILSGYYSPNCLTTGSFIKHDIFTCRTFLLSFLHHLTVGAAILQWEAQ